VLSVFDIDVDPSAFADVLPELVHPDSEARLAAIVESTQVQDVFAVADQFGASTDSPTAAS
jgi:hypothetical protein